MHSAGVPDPNRISTLSGVAHMLARGIETYGIDSHAVFERAGIDLSDSRNPESRLPSVAMQKVWHMATKLSGDDCFGISIAQNVQPTALHGLGFAWMASDTLADALDRLARYYRVLVTAGEVILDHQSAESCLWYKIPDHRGQIAWSSIDAALGIFLQMSRLTAGSDVSPVRIEMQRPKPDCLVRMEAFFNCPVTFEAAENRIYFDRVRIHAQLPTANPALARINDQVVMDYLARCDRNDIVNRVRTQIIERLPSGLPAQNTIADSLHMSTRNLQRKLNEADTSFKTLLDDIRQQLAKQYLREQQRSVGEISFLLGFSEHTNFTRAFRRWTAMSPEQFRESVR